MIQNRRSGSRPISRKSSFNFDRCKNNILILNFVKKIKEIMEKKPKIE